MMTDQADARGYYVLLNQIGAIRRDHLTDSLTDVKQGNIILDLVFRGTENIVSADLEELHGISTDAPPLARALEAAIAER